MSKQSFIFALSSLVLTSLSVSSAFAESDFFQMEREDVRSRLEQKIVEEEVDDDRPSATTAAEFESGNYKNSASDNKKSGFSIEAIFNQPSEEEIKAQKRKEGWSDFEDVSGTEAEKKYYNSKEMKIRRELSKPLPKRDSFGDENIYDSLEESVNSLGASKKEKRARR